MIRLVLTLILLAGLTVSSAEAARGRAKVFRNTLTADNDALLRGVTYNTDLNGGALPDRTAVTRIRDRGMKALHVYAETPFCPVAPGSDGQPESSCPPVRERAERWIGQEPGTSTRGAVGESRRR